jgi:hypothetical protein
MSKKLIFSIVVAVVAALVVGSVALAAGNVQLQALASEDQAARRRARGLGQVTGIGENQFTAQLLKRGEVTVLVDEKTRFFNSDGSEAAFGDLQVGRWVAGVVLRQKDGTLLARRVMLLPEGFDPTQVDRRAAGKVTAVDVAGSTLTLETRRGKTLIFNVTENTFFIGKAQGLDEIEVGMKAAVGAQTNDDGTLTALTITARSAAKK